MLKKEMPEKFKNFFKDHVLKYKNVGGVEFLTLSKENTVLNRVDYIIKENILVVTGDRGDAIFKFTESVSLKKFYEEYNDFYYYFMGKLGISTYPKNIFSEEKFKENIRIEAVKFYKNNKESLSRKELKECINIYNKTIDIIKNSSNITDSLDMFFEDIIFEDSSSKKARELSVILGRVNGNEIHPNFEIYFWGLKLAYEILKKKEMAKCQ